MKINTFQTKNSKLVVITCILLLTLSSLVSVMPALAYYVPPSTQPTGTYVGISPTLTGIDQTVVASIMVTPSPESPSQIVAHLVGADPSSFMNISLTIVKPDGTQETTMPIDRNLAKIGINVPGAARIDGHIQFDFTPDQIGNYTFTATFPGQTFTNEGLTPNSTVANHAVYYEPSTSDPTVLTVQQDKVIESGAFTGWPWSPLPENYWEHPLSTDNREWASITGPWIKANYDTLATNYNPYSTAPKAPHILWKNQVDLSGLVGGVMGSMGYSTSGAGQAPIILDGRIYQSSALTPGALDCIDLRTGELIWTKTTAVGGVPSQASQLNFLFQTAAQQSQGGIQPTLMHFTPGNWFFYDAFTLTPLGEAWSNAPTSVVDVPFDISTPTFENGNPVTYLIQTGGYNTTEPLNNAYMNLIMWNFTRLTNYGDTFIPNVDNQFSKGVQWNVSIRQPDGWDPGVRLPDLWPTITAHYLPNAGVVIVQGSTGIMGFDASTGEFLWKSTTVQSVWWTNLPGLTGPETHGPLMVFDASMPGWTAYDVTTGEIMWSTEIGPSPWNNLMSSAWAFHNGMFYAGHYDGHVYAFDTKTGEIEWTSDWTGKTDETPFGNHPLNGGEGNSGFVGADGTLYVSSSTVYMLQPRTRFNALYAIDESDGSFIWKLPIGISPKSIAYGYLTGHDFDHGMQYCIGKGKTATTVSAPMTSVDLGDTVLIQGTVMDLSPAQPNTPAISDADMGEWMDYLHGQNATLINNPPKPNGVEVSLTAVDSNGNTQNLGTTTSDFEGLYSLTWTPEVEGKYTVYATFDGSESYWSSSDATAFNVDPAPAPATTIEPEEPIDDPVDTEEPTSFITTEVAIIAAVAVAAVIGVATYFLLKRK
ncbi:MAG: PQQ-binding-like beta-propeller repeat protein [archaeon]